MVLAGLPALANEKRIDRSALPTAVQKTVDIETQGATVHRFSHEAHGKGTFYEVELVTNGHSKDVLIDGRGEIVEVEEELANRKSS